MKLFIAALAVLAAPALAAQVRDVEAMYAPESTPVMHARMFRNLDEGQSFKYLSARATDAEESSKSSSWVGVAVPCVAAAVGVAGFVAYKRRSASANTVSSEV